MKRAKLKREKNGKRTHIVGHVNMRWNETNKNILFKWKVVHCAMFTLIVLLPHSYEVGERWSYSRQTVIADQTFKIQIEISIKSYLLVSYMAHQIFKFDIPYILLFISIQFFGFFKHFFFVYFFFSSNIHSIFHCDLKNFYVFIESKDSYSFFLPIQMCACVYVECHDPKGIVVILSTSMTRPKSNIRKRNDNKIWMATRHRNYLQWKRISNELFGGANW